MKKAGLVILFTIICAITFAQAHTYNACCRYGKGNVMGDCVCPGCKKDKDDEIKASQEETKQLQAKAAAEQAVKDAAAKKAREDEANKKAKETNTITINTPKLTNDKTPSGYNAELFFSERKKYEIRYVQTGQDLKEKNKPRTAKLLYNGKVIGTVSIYKDVSCVGPNIFEGLLPDKFPEDRCKEWISQKNNAHLFDGSGKRLSVGGYNEFGYGIFINDGVIKAYSVVGDCLNYTDEPERYVSSYKMKTLKANYKDLSTIINETEVLLGDNCDCAGNLIIKQ